MYNYIHYSVFILCLCNLSHLSAAEEPIRVEHGGLTWESAYQTDDLRLEDNQLAFSTHGTDPQIIAQDVNWEADEIEGISITMSASRGHTAQLFWAPWSEKRSIRFRIIPDGHMHTYYLPLQDHPEWAGTLQEIRFDPVATAGADIRIHNIEGATPPLSSKAVFHTSAADLWITPAQMPLVITGALINVSGGDISIDLKLVSRGMETDLHTPAAVRISSTTGSIPVTLQAVLLDSEGSLEIRDQSSGATLKTFTFTKHRKTSTASASHVITDFKQGQSSQWSVPADIPPAMIQASEKGLIAQVKSGISVYLRQHLTALRTLSCAVHSDEQCRLAITLKNRAGDELNMIGQIPETGALTWSVPTSFATAEITRLEITGTGQIQLQQITADCAPDSGAWVWSGPGVYRNNQLDIPGVILEQNSSFQLKPQFGQTADIKLTLDEVKRGAGISRESAQQVFTGNETLTAQLTTLHPGIYDATIQTYNRPVYKERVYIIPSGDYITALQEQQSRPLYGAPPPLSDPAPASFTYKIDPLQFAEADMTLYETDLYPGWVIDIKDSQVSLFEELSEIGLGQPSYIAAATRHGVRVFDSTHHQIRETLTEPWLLCWFSDAEGWQYTDYPMLILLQRKPHSIERTEEAMNIDFGTSAGMICMLPLYGSYYPPQEGHQILEDRGLADQGVHPWKWKQGLPSEVLKRIRLLARISRAVPIHADEYFNVQPSLGSISVMNEYRYLDIRDDWQTAPIYTAPLPPTLAFTTLEPHDFPIQIQQTVTDLDYATPYGPYMTLLHTNRLEYTVADLTDYINEAEIQFPLPPDAEPQLKYLQQFVNEALNERFMTSPDFMVEFDRKLFVWAQLAEHVYPKALAYAYPHVQAKVKAAFTHYYNTFFFGTEAHPADGERGWYPGDKSGASPQVSKWLRQQTLAIDGPGIHGGIMGDSGKISASALFNIWCYAHYAGDTHLVRERWPFLRKLNTNPLNADWKFMGRGGNAEGGEHMPPVMAAARLAYMAGDLQHYYFSVYQFMREALITYLKQRDVGTAYFRQRQPMMNTSPMPYWALPAHVEGEAYGWALDTVGFLSGIALRGEIQAQNRWVRFSSEDSGRIYREHYRSQAADELAAMAEDTLVLHDQPTSETASFAASQLRLSSYLLDTPYQQLLELFPPDTWAWDKDNNGAIMMALAVIRSAVDRTYQRLIPADLSDSGWQLGLQRQPVLKGWRGLVMFRWPERTPAWPKNRLYLRGKTVGINDRHLTLGRVIPGNAPSPTRMESEQISWVTRKTAFWK